MHDVIIIGSGPAGLSAAVYTARAGLDTLVISRGEGSLWAASKVDNYLGFPQGISGKELIKAGTEQAKRFGCAFTADEITGIMAGNGFEVSTTEGVYNGKTVLIATGKPSKKPKLTGISDFEGRGVSYCAICDGFFYRGKNVGVLGAGLYAQGEARELAHFAAKVTIFTDGQPTQFDADAGFDQVTEKLALVFGEDKLAGLIGVSGEKYALDGLFIAVGKASARELAIKTGIVMANDGSIAVNRRMETNIPGLFAAGDCTGGVLQVSKSVGEGAAAGLAIIEYVRNLEE